MHVASVATPEFLLCMKDALCMTQTAFAITHLLHGPVLVRLQLSNDHRCCLELRVKEAAAVRVAHVGRDILTGKKYLVSSVCAFMLTIQALAFVAWLMICLHM